LFVPQQRRRDLALPAAFGGTVQRVVVGQLAGVAVLDLLDLEIEPSRGAFREHRPE